MVGAVGHVFRSRGDCLPLLLVERIPLQACIVIVRPGASNDVQGLLAVIRAHCARDTCRAGDGDARLELCPGRILSEGKRRKAFFGISVKDVIMDDRTMAFQFHGGFWNDHVERTHVIGPSESEVISSRMPVEGEMRIVVVVVVVVVVASRRVL